MKLQWYWRDFLVPPLPPGNDAYRDLPWNKFLEHGFCLVEDSDLAFQFYVSLAGFDLATMPIEYVLIAVETLNRSFDKKSRSKKYRDILKGLFKAKRNGTKRWLALIVFDDFRYHCLNVLRLRVANRMKCKDTSAMLLLLSIVKLIANCHQTIIKHKEHSHQLLQQGINFEKVISEVSGPWTDYHLFSSGGAHQHWFFPLADSQL